MQTLNDFDVREMARFALDRIPTAAAAKALAEADEKLVGEEFRVGVTNALGKRRDAVAVEALKKATGDTSGEIRLAAARGWPCSPMPAAMP